MSYEKQPGTGSTALGYGEEEWTVKMYTDGTTTEAEVIPPPHSDFVGHGVARRRKGDKRKDDVGLALALARAFESAAASLRGVADDILEGRVAP